jgi:hypothetical protein
MKVSGINLIELCKNYSRDWIKLTIQKTQLSPSYFSNNIRNGPNQKKIKNLEAPFMSELNEMMLVLCHTMSSYLSITFF